jgi:hypothetical protein
MTLSEHASTFVYIGNSKSNEIAIFILNSEVLIHFQLAEKLN